MKRTLQLIALLSGAACFLGSCSRDFLDTKPSTSLVVPHTLEDFRQLLDYGNMAYSVPDRGEVQADDYFITDEVFEMYSGWGGDYSVFINSYIWAEDIYGTEEGAVSWTNSYQKVFYANVVLDGLKGLEGQRDNAEYRRIKGSAYFFRALGFYHLSQLFAPVYREETAGSEMGLPLPLSSDVNEPIKRRSVQETYDRILADLVESVKLLEGVQVDYSRPSRAAALALRAKVCLGMGRYSDAGNAASLALADYNDLTDYNISDVRDYRKVIFLGYFNPASFINSHRVSDALIDTALYASYGDVDLRKTVHFTIGAAGRPIKRQLYGLSGTTSFCGLDTDELFLIRAECAARSGEVGHALDDLNHLLKHRYKSDGFVQRTAADKEEALGMILEERRKELVLRGVRWSDLRRFNRDGAGIALRRLIAGREYRLEPSSPRWVYPIPTDEIRTSGIAQNNR